MKKTVLFAAVAAFFLASCGSEESTPEVAEVVKASYSVDTEASVINWHGYKTNKEEHKHKGTVMLSGGTLSTEDGKIVMGSFDIDMKTIAEPEGDSAMAVRLVGHLMSPDFFNVADFVTASLKITGVAENGDLSGELTVMGVTKPIEFPATVSVDGDKLTASAEFAYDLSQFGVPYLQVPGEDADEEVKQGAISPMVNFSVSIVANKQ